MWCFGQFVLLLSKISFFLIHQFNMSSFVFSSSLHYSRYLVRFRELATSLFRLFIDKCSSVCVALLFIYFCLQEVLNKTETELSTVEFTSDSSAVEATETNKCMLCLDVVRDITTTVCGHMFCWKCIIDWCTVKVALC